MISAGHTHNYVDNSATDDTTITKEPCRLPSHTANQQANVAIAASSRGTTMTEEWDDISFVISSRYRVVALRRLDVGPATPSQIATDADVGIAHVSRALQGLRDRSLVDLLVSDDRKKGRVYGLTERGEEIWNTIEAENMASE